MNEPGSQPIYLILASYDVMLWAVDGATERLARVVVATRRSPSGDLAAAGVTGVPRDHVSFKTPNTCFNDVQDATSFDAATVRATLVTALGRGPNSFAAAYSAGGVRLPSAEPSPPRAGDVQLPDGFDRQMWAEAIAAAPAGIIRVGPAAIVAPRPATPYDILPDKAGLA
jgi:hypothetical protein